ncbi:hypothetical protein NOI24_21325 [Neorhizobium galegae]|uniref:hypothetical protein n=1 Tax=Neorhizobium galegae TaxID=399 RepID=UPI002102A539|nr:hypothetical protein [Neorhizobium galegae]MCQ1773859.1 hypothetical protein [Neorhizobium galegae]MCQ1799674.1 hypothetical protein [Neorhizobium galegae]
MEMKTKYTFDNLAKNKEIRAAYMRDYEKLIRSLKDFGYTKAALHHARNKQRIAEELTLLD